MILVVITSIPHVIVYYGLELHKAVFAPIVIWQMSIEDKKLKEENRSVQVVLIHLMFFIFRNVIKVTIEKD